MKITTLKYKTLLCFIFTFIFFSPVFSQVDSLNAEFCDEIVKRGYSNTRLKELIQKGADPNCDCYIEKSVLSWKTLIPTIRPNLIPKWKLKYKDVIVKMSTLQYAVKLKEDSLLSDLFVLGADPYLKKPRDNYNYKNLNFVQQLAIDNDTTSILKLVKHKIDFLKAAPIYTDNSNCIRIFMKHAVPANEIRIGTDFVFKNTIIKLDSMLNLGIPINHLTFTTNEFVQLPQEKIDILAKYGFTCSQINKMKCSPSDADSIISKFPSCINDSVNAGDVPLFIVALMGGLTYDGADYIPPAKIDLEEATRLKNLGANLNTKNWFSIKIKYDLISCNNLMELAINMKDEAFLIWLLDQNVSPNIINSINTTPIFDAILRDNIAMTKILVERGADLNVKGPKNKNPAKYAKFCKHKEIYKYLKVKTAEQNKKRK